MSAWREQAACNGRDDIDWFPVMDKPGGQSQDWRANIAAAKLVCSACTVSAQCLAAALVDPLTAGIWGGTTEAERRGRHTPLRAPRARCGTDSGYSRHRNDGEEPCQLCREAHAMAYRLRRHRMAIVR